MRIVGGKFRGRKIKQPDSASVRPTKDRIRESVFNVLTGEMEGSYVLDLYSGSGAYGLESLSRGAEKAVFVDKSPECCRVIKENVISLGVGDYVNIITTDSFDFIKDHSRGGARQFDIIFLDPPYNSNLVKKSLIIINQYDILIHSGLLVIEHHYEENLPQMEGDITVLKQKTYKDIVITVYRKI